LFDQAVAKGSRVKGDRGRGDIVGVLRNESRVHECEGRKFGRYDLVALQDLRVRAFNGFHLNCQSLAVEVNTQEQFVAVLHHGRWHHLLEVRHAIRRHCDFKQGGIAGKSLDVGKLQDQQALPVLGDGRRIDIWNRALYRSLGFFNMLEPNPVLNLLACRRVILLFILNAFLLLCSFFLGDDL